MPADLNSFLRWNRETDTLKVSLRGEWAIGKDPPDWASLSKLLADEKGVRAITFDVASLGRYDSSLVSLLLQFQKNCQEKGVSFDRGNLPHGLNDLLDMALSVPEKTDARPESHPPTILQRIGASSLKVLDEGGKLFEFIGECVFSSGRFLRGRARFRKEDFWVALQGCGLEALPIVSLISLLVGMILAFVGAYQMATIGATIYVANLVAIAMVREMGCLMTGIIMSGRTGAAFAAQLGSMRVNEEIDALKTFGFSPIDFLVLPRMLALIIMMPLLTIYSNVVGMAGGALVACLGFDVGFKQYLNQTLNVLTLGSSFLGVGKSVIFGVIVAGAGCLRGMQSGSSSSAVGDAATSAVVVSITSIVVADCFFAIVTTVLKI